MLTPFDHCLVYFFISWDKSQGTSESFIVTIIDQLRQLEHFYFVHNFSNRSLELEEIIISLQPHAERQ